MAMHKVSVERSPRERPHERTVIGLLAIPIAALAVAMGGCRASARDDFISARSVTLKPIIGDASAFRESRRLPVPGFVRSERMLTRAPDE